MSTFQLTFCICLYTEQLSNYTDLGCYKEKKGKKRALSNTLADLRQQKDAKNKQLIIKQCAYVARDWGYDHFAVINLGICVSGKDAVNNYNKYGEITDDASKYCKDGVGKTKASMEVYRMQ